MTGVAQDATRSRTLDILRGIAILYVVVYHFYQYGVGTEAIPLPFVMGWTGVDLFFVLSGFLLGGQLLDHRDAPNYYTVFYGRRATRILPLYLLFLEVFLTFFIAGGRGLKVWPFATFTQNIVWAATPADGNEVPGVLVATWSLAVEEQFYLVLPLLLRRVHPRHVLAMILGLIVAAPLLRVGLAYGCPGLPMAAFYLMPCRMDSLFAGVLCAWILRREAGWRFVVSHRTTLFIAVGIALAGHGWMAANGMRPASWQMWSVGYSWNAVLYALILLLAVTGAPAHRLVRPLLTPLVGAAWISYSAYLLHEPVIFAQPLLPRGAATPVAAFALVALSTLSWRWIEQPFIRAGRRLWAYPPSDPASVGIAAARPS